jgi:hypothetical protein
MHAVKFEHSLFTGILNRADVLLCKNICASHRSALAMIDQFGTRALVHSVLLVANSIPGDGGGSAKNSPAATHATLSAVRGCPVFVPATALKSAAVEVDGDAAWQGSWHGAGCTGLGASAAFLLLSAACRSCSCRTERDAGKDSL